MFGTVLTNWGDAITSTKNQVTRSLLMRANYDPYGAIKEAYAAFARGEIGNVDLSMIIMFAIAFILIGVAIRFSPNVIKGFSAAYAEATSADPNGTIFIGLTDTLGIGPTAVILGFVVGVAIVGFLGIKMATGKE